jgi:cytoskeletal protein CcmA (bactofilin family)
MGEMNRASGAAAVAVCALLLLAVPSPALAQERTEKNDLVVMTGRAEVREGETFDTVVIFDGPVTVEGTVRHAVVAFNGPVDVSGSVQEDVVSFNGPITIRSGATVGGDVVSRTAPVVEEGATVEGDIRRNPFDLFRDPFPFVARFVAWVAVTVSMLILGLLLLLLAPRGMDAVADTWRTGTGPSIGWGLLLLIGLPIVAVLLLITLVGIPLGFGMLFALGLIYAIGYVAGAWVLGRLLLKPPTSRILAFLAGLGILRLVALVPILAGIVGFVATVVGLGSVLVAAWRARRAAVAVTP